MSEPALRHIRHLAGTIGPRGSCTPQEREASEYCRGVLQDLGYHVEVQPFRAARSGWAPYSIASGLILAAVLMSVLLTGPPAGPIAALLCAGVTASTLLALVFRPNPLAWLVPKGISQNVYAVAHSSGESRRTVVITGHVDTQRTPLAMASLGAFRVFRALTTLGVVSFVVLTVILSLRAAGWKDLSPWVIVAPCAVIGGVLAMTLQPEFSAYVPGANDNASGAAVVLALAGRLKTRPPVHTTVWLLASGAEEVGATGPVHLMRRHRELKEAGWIVLDTIAGPGTDPCVITAEELIVPLRADPGLLEHARAEAADRPRLGVREHHYRGLFSEHSLLAAAGCRSLAIINFTPAGLLPHWHRQSDTVANIDVSVLNRTEEFVWGLLQRLDGEA